MSTKKEITITANIRKLQCVHDFIASTLSDLHIDKTTENNIMLCAEEVFVNICCYAYGDSEGDATVTAELADDGKELLLTFIDSGIPFDPISQDEVDIDSLGEQREIGGLGIYLVKQLSDELSYRYGNGCNVLTVKKLLN